MGINRWCQRVDQCKTGEARLERSDWGGQTEEARLGRSDWVHWVHWVHWVRLLDPQSQNMITFASLRPDTSSLGLPVDASVPSDLPSPEPRDTTCRRSWNDRASSRKMETPDNRRYLRSKWLRAIKVGLSAATDGGMRRMQLRRTDGRSCWYLCDGGGR